MRAPPSVLGAGPSPLTHTELEACSANSPIEKPVDPSVPSCLSSLPVSPAGNVLMHRGSCHVTLAQAARPAWSGRSLAANAFL